MTTSGILNSPTFDVVNAQVFYLSAQNPIISLDSPVELTALYLRPCAATSKVGQLSFTGDFFSPPKQTDRASAQTLNPALPPKKGTLSLMDTRSIPTNAHSGQTQADSLATPLDIQRTLSALRRQLADSDAAVLRLFAERHELQEAITAETVRYQDALGADRLAAAGVGAVSEVERWLNL